jgi:hypothetical protein
MVMSLCSVQSIGYLNPSFLPRCLPGLLFEGTAMGLLGWALFAALIVIVLDL